MPQQPPQFDWTNLDKSLGEQTGTVRAEDFILLDDGVAFVKFTSYGSTYYGLYHCHNGKRINYPIELPKQLKEQPKTVWLNRYADHSPTEHATPQAAEKYADEMKKAGWTRSPDHAIPVRVE